MAGALVWDASGERFYETGVSKGVLYPIHTDGSYPQGYAWNGLIGVTETPGGAEANALYADNIKYLSLVGVETFGGTIEAYTYPDAFAACDGQESLLSGAFTIGQQLRKQFALCFQSKLGNDASGDAYGYKIHLLYGCLAAPSERAFASINESPEAVTFSWEFTATPVAMTGKLAVACLVVNSKKADATKLAAFEKIIYGQTTPSIIEPRLPLPNEVLTLLTP